MGRWDGGGPVCMGDDAGAARQAQPGGVLASALMHPFERRWRTGSKIERAEGGSTARGVAGKPPRSKG